MALQRTSLTRHGEQMVLGPTSSLEGVLGVVLAVANLYCPWNGVCGVFPGNVSGTPRWPQAVAIEDRWEKEQSPMMHLGCAVSGL